MNKDMRLTVVTNPETIFKLHLSFILALTLTHRY